MGLMYMYQITTMANRVVIGGMKVRSASSPVVSLLRSAWFGDVGHSAFDLALICDAGGQRESSVVAH
jgi:hypothetical protein